jgi:two-component system CheB/CheR fusion protein
MDLEGTGEKEGTFQAVPESDSSSPRGNPFPIAGIGASAGGPEAFARFIGALPADTGIAFVFVQHLDPVHESLLPELLAPMTPMPVVSVTDGMEIEPNRIHGIPPNTSMELVDGVLRLAKRGPGLHMPLDMFFRSPARVQGSKSIGIVLSGNATELPMDERVQKLQQELHETREYLSNLTEGYEAHG